MAPQDTCCSIAPYFIVHDGQLDAFKALGEQCMAKAQTEAKCLYYGLSFDGNVAYVREGYEDGDGVLAHLDNVGDLLGELLKIADLTRLEIHGPEAELAKLRGPLADMKAQFFTLEYGIRR